MDDAEVRAAKIASPVVVRLLLQGIIGGGRGALSTAAQRIMHEILPTRAAAPVPTTTGDVCCAPCAQTDHRRPERDTAAASNYVDCKGPASTRRKNRVGLTV